MSTIWFLRDNAHNPELEQMRIQKKTKRTPPPPEQLSLEDSIFFEYLKKHPLRQEAQG